MLNCYKISCSSVYNIILVLLILSIGTFVLTWNLENQSISPISDEVIHIRVTQEMLQSGSWWLPTHGGLPYFNKPPFKFWLTLLSVRLFGESNLSYRLIEVLAGLGLLIVLFQFCFHFYRSRAIGLISCLLLLSSRKLIVGTHCLRSGTMDALLLFLTTLACYCICRLFTLEEESAERRDRGIEKGTLSI